MSSFSKSPSRSQREHAWNRTGGRCAYCGCELNPFRFDVEHMHPRNQGGTSKLSNLTASCKSCNHRKKDKTVEEFRAYLGQSIAERIRSLAEDLESWSDYYDIDITQYLDALETCAVELKDLFPVFYFERLAQESQDDQEISPH